MTDGNTERWAVIDGAAESLSAAQHMAARLNSIDQSLQVPRPDEPFSPHPKSDTRVPSMPKKETMRPLRR